MTKTLIAGLFLVNIFDTVLHIAINQPEPLRITSNLIMIAASLLILLKIKLDKRYVVLSALVLYLALNLIFIMNNGIGNLGVILIMTTTILSLANIFYKRN